MNHSHELEQEEAERVFDGGKRSSYARTCGARVTLAIGLLVTMMFVLLDVAPAGAAEALSPDTSAAGFALGSVAQPTNFSVGQNVSCEQEEATAQNNGHAGVFEPENNTIVAHCNSYTVTVRNEGTQSTGVAKVGETETCQAGAWNGEPSGYTYRWLSDGEEVGTEPSYTVREGDAGHTVQCQVIASNAYGSAADTSTALRVTPLGSVAPPALVVNGGEFSAPRVTISGGTPEVGAALGCEPGTWEYSGPEALHYKYAWLHNGAVIPGATENVYMVPAEFEGQPSKGQAIQCQVTTPPEAERIGTYVGDPVTADSSDSEVIEPSSGAPPQLATNELTLADAPAVSGDTVTLKDTQLPAGVTAIAVAGGAGIHAGNQAPGSAPLNCELAPAPSCRFPDALAPGAMLEMQVFVTVQQSTGELKANQAEASGGTTPSRSTTQEPEGKVVPTPVSTAEPPLGVQDFSFQAFDANGLPDTQAGDHPNAVSVAFDFPVLPDTASPLSASVKDVRVDLPLGLIGDPVATPRCPEYDISGQNESESRCPAASLVGYLGFFSEGSGTRASEFKPIYNVAPQHGYPAEFATTFLGREVPLFASLIPAPDGGGYDIQVTVPGITRFIPITATTLTFFGDPAQHSGTGQAQAFFTNPDTCGSDPTARIEVDSYQEPGNYRSRETSLFAPGETLSGCSLLQFSPTLEAKPEAESSQADTPSGYEVTLKVPQAPNSFPTLATPELKNTTVTMPAGVAVSPSAAHGLQGCSEAQVGLEDHEGHSVPLEEVNGAGHEDGQEHLTPGHCPAASQIGSLEIVTPLLEAPLKGHVYLAQPQCGGAGQPECTEAAAEEGKLFGLYLEAEGSGAIVKLAGSVEAGGYGAHSQQTGLAPGQLRARFDENPQLPFSEVKLKFNNGPRAPLANPQSCGTYATSSAFEAWSAATSSYTSPAFAITGCSGQTPFSPAFSSGTTSTGAGAFTNFTTTFSRTEGQQDLAGITVNTPEGLLGDLSKVALCGEAQANAGSCGPVSQIGTTTVTAGSGSEPYTLHGSVYLTGPYKGQPFGLSIVVPAVAGPFNLGLEVVRASIAVNPVTSALTIISNPLPQSKDGVPFRLQTVNVEVNKPGFMFNPTDCDAEAVSATISGTGGAVVPVSTLFAASNCASLPFKPSFFVSTAARTSKTDGASLVVKVAQRPGEANIHKVALTIPTILPARLTTLQKACTEAQFNANPAGCPEASVIGTGTAHTPVLQVPLTGPAYLVSHGGAAFPDVEFVLQANERGGNVEIVLDGKTDIKKGITYSRFETVPDAPISSFEAALPEGSHSILTTEHPGSTNLCALVTTKTVKVNKRVLLRRRGKLVRRHGHMVHVTRKVKRTVATSTSLVIPTTITGQNGAVTGQSTKVAVTGCPSTRTKAAHKLKKKRNKDAGKHSSRKNTNARK